MMDGQRDDYIDSHTPRDATPLGTPPSVTPAIYERLQDMARQGHSRTYAGRAFGLHRETIRKVPGIEWPARGQSKEAIAARERQKDPAWRARRSAMLRAQRNGHRYTLPDGRVMTVREIADETGISRKTIRSRLRRGQDVFAPVNELRKTAKKGWRNKTWTVEMSQSDWAVVIDYARQTSAKQAYHKFGVPQGAIAAILRGQFWRVAGYDLG